MKDIKLTPDKRHHFFLIFKEGIHNIVKYAQCTETRIFIYRDKNKVVMEIRDNGIGFDINTKFAGNGMHSMRERTKKLNGDLIINSAPGKGTTIILKFDF